jgi:hypothetical protein
MNRKHRQGFDRLPRQTEKFGAIENLKPDLTQIDEMSVSYRNGALG